MQLYESILYLYLFLLHASIPSRESYLALLHRIASSFVVIAKSSQVKHLRVRMINLPTFIKGFMTMKYIS